MKTYLQNSLARLGIYERVKSSWIYDAYWTVMDRKIITDRNSEINFYRNLLEGFRYGDLVFDVGANHGYKTDIFLRLGAKVLAVEPDSCCQQVLSDKFLKHRVRNKPVTIATEAVSDKNTTTTMWIDTPGSAKNTLSEKWAETLRRDTKRFGQVLGFEEYRKIETVTLERLIDRHGVPFFIKIDVEGHELSVLRGMKRPVRYLSFEVNLPEFREEGVECVRLLESLAPDGEFSYTPDCRKGLVGNQWYRAAQLLNVVNFCTDPSIEIFWRTGVRA